MERYVGKPLVDAVVVGPKVDVSGLVDKVIIQEPLEAEDIPYRHDRQLLRAALDKVVQKMG